jgi:hypothetical protein
MSYKKLPIGTANPGLIIILIDQSGSMSSAYAENKSRAEVAASAVNKTIHNILIKCSAGAVIKDRCHLGVIGYGAGASVVVAGTISEVFGMKSGEETYHVTEEDGAGGTCKTEETVPIWVTPKAVNGTPMAEGFDLASELVEAWTRENPGNFPPIVINVTDGAPDDEARARQAAQRLTSFGTNDGQTLLFAAHIGDPSVGEVILPPDSTGLGDPCARFLYDTSSIIPPTLLGAAEQSFQLNRKLTPATRGFVMNAAAHTLSKLLIFGSTPITSTTASRG